MAGRSYADMRTAAKWDLDAHMEGRGGGGGLSLMNGLSIY